MSSMISANAPGAKKGGKEDENEIDIEQMSADIRKLIVAIHRTVEGNKDAVLEAKSMTDILSEIE